jgi:hypothetical protein
MDLQLFEPSELRAIGDAKEREGSERRSNEAEIEICGRDAEGIIHWFDHYVWTYDPRLLKQRDENGNRMSAYVPFVLWPRQRDFIRWLWDRYTSNEEWLVEKSRDTGVSYLTCGFALNRWLFEPGYKGTFGSRKTDYVDKSNQPDSLFEKMRIMLDRLPAWMKPPGFVMSQHSLYMRLVNPATGAIITGEGGEEMGRGGRSSIYVVDEAAFVPNAEGVEKALSGNTDCIGWVSTVNGMGNLFARKRHSILAEHQIFRLHWSDDPRKTAEWAAKKRASMSDDSAWQSEYEIDYAASMDGICIPASWIRAAQQLADLVPEAKQSNFDPVLGGDVGAGKARSVIVPRRGHIIDPPHSRGSPDTIGTANWMLDLARDHQADLLNFDAPGVGEGVKSGLINSEQRPHKLMVQAINTGSDPFVDPDWPDGRTSAEQFVNLKAELWWLARQAFKRTFEHVQWLQGVSVEDGAQQHHITDLISMPKGDQESDRLASELSMVRWFRNDRGKIIIESKIQLARRGVKSPDYADALVLTFVPDRGGGYTLDHI